MRARNNPYRTERLHSLSVRLEGTSGEELLQRFDELGGRACILGPHGSGKTTILLTLADLLRRQGSRVEQHVLRADGPPTPIAPLLERLTPGKVIILDGADLLGPLDWNRIRRSAGRLIVSSHHKRLLPILYECRPSPELLADLIQELHPGNDCRQPSARELYRRHRGNLRDALLELYDFHATLPAGRLCEGKPRRCGEPLFGAVVAPS